MTLKDFLINKDSMCDNYTIYYKSPNKGLVKLTRMFSTKKDAIAYVQDICYEFRNYED